jgi:hypothetical protein
MKRDSISLFELAIEYSSCQDEILGLMNAAYPTIARELNPQKWPQIGAIEALGVSWRFTRHGMGFTFEADDGRVVNAHEFIDHHPYPIDAYRIQLYCESVGLAALSVDSTTIDISDIWSIESGLDKLISIGLLRLDDRSRVSGPKSYVIQ